MKIISIILLAGAFILIACESETLETPIDCSSKTITGNLVGNVTDVTCGEANGEFTIDADGGSPPYTFSVAGNSNTSGQFSNLSAGNYTVNIEDNDGCSGTFNVSISNIEGVNINVSTEEAGCGDASGVISIEATGGSAPYQYQLNGEMPSDNAEFTNLMAGSHEVKVIDAEGCEVTQALEIPSGISFENSIASIIETNCAIATCHAGTQSPDFRQFSNIQNNANSIMQRTSAGTMPPTGSLPQSEIDLIACWVEDGALNN